MLVYIVRHTPVATGREICYGQSEVPLAASFAEDAARLKAQLPHDFDAVYCSPLKRCVDLVAALNVGAPQLEDALMEVNFGQWENQRWNDIDGAALKHWMSDFVNVNPPGGESLLALFPRVQAFFDGLRNERRDKVLIVTHAGVIRCLWAYLLEIPLKHIFKIPVGYGEVFTVKLSEDPALDAIRRMV